MFDKLIVSEPEGAGARSRKNYFLVSTLAVASLALAAVVVSIYAEELTLGADSIELSILVMPVDPPAEQPQPPRQQPQRSQPDQPSQNKVATRTELIAPVDRPERVPTSTSVNPNKFPSIPTGIDFKIGRTNTDPSGSGRDVNGNDHGGIAPSNDAGPVADKTRETEPPPRPRHAEPAGAPVVSRGVVNGEAKYLPKPDYPKTAQAVRVEGKVDVQVLIDENGHVVSAKAVSGNALLRAAAESAARSARFKPTTLSDVPVKVTGVIVYNFNLS
jgi:protein TonB